jgi:hypothetical protein
MKRWGLSLIFGLIGALTLLVGSIFGGFGANWLNDEAARLEALPVVSAVSFEDRPLGTEVLIEGMADPRTTTRFRSYVAYIREEYRGENDDGNAIWFEDERITPALRIALADGEVQLIAGEYQLYQPLTAWQDSESLRWSGAVGTGTKRYRGIELGAPMIAVGKIVAGSEGPALQAAFIAGGNRADYLDDQRLGAAIFRWLGIGLAVFGGILLLVAVIVVVRIR